MHAKDPDSKRAGDRDPDKKPDGNRPPAKDGTKDQLEALFRANISWLRGWLGARLHGRRRQDADDLCQEILLKALRSVGTLRRPESFSAWLYKIANNKLKDYLRQRTRRQREVQGVDTEHEDPRKFEDEIVREEELGKLIEVVLALPARYREPMILRHVQDLGYDEIARILGITKNNVQVRIFRGRRMLRESIAGLNRLRGGKRNGRRGLESSGGLEALPREAASSDAQDSKSGRELGRSEVRRSC